MYTFNHKLRPPPAALPAAGLPRDGGHITAADCLHSGGSAGAATTAYQELSAAVLQPPQQQEGQGAAAPRACAGTRQDGVGACLKQGPTSPFLQQMEEVKEAAYKRNKLEPLGRSRECGVVLPEGLGSERAFGLAQNARELERSNQGKQAIYFCGPGGGGESEAVHALYVRTHRDFQPGEQRKYGYDWKGADPATLTFGKPPAVGSAIELKAALQPGVPDDLGAMSEQLQRFALKNRDMLGMPRSPGAMERNLPAEYTYGRPPPRGEWGADRILRGTYAPTEQAPDAGLGKPAAAKGAAVAAAQCASPSPPAGFDRAFTNAAASPSLVAAGAAAGAAGPRGRQPQAGMVELLRPIDSVFRGVTEDHFRQPRSRQEMWELVTASGVVHEPAAFEAIYEQACTVGGAEGVKCCTLEGFIKAKAEMAKGAVLGVPPPN